MAILLAALTGATQVSAQETIGGMEGVWRGTVGEQPIHACFNDDTGVYYYDRHLRPIFLRPDGARFAERIGWDKETSARWSITYSGADRVEGEWSDGERQLPIRLRAVPWTVADRHASACESQAFMGPRLAGGQIETEPATLGKAGYTKLTFVPPAHFSADDLSIQTIALDGTRYGDISINYALAFHLPRGTIGDAYAECFARPMAFRGVDGYFHKFVEPELITPRWLGVIESNSVECGGAHPSHWQSRRVFDRNSGKEIEVTSWLSDQAMDREILAEDTPDADVHTTLNQRFVDVLLRHWQPITDSASEDEREHRDSCMQAAGEQSYWNVGLAAQSEGLAFIPSLPHVIAVCAETVVVPWGELAPFLTMEGRAAMLSLQAND
ncbi:hypothetical protein [Pontixanthobacter aquaemixtae]|uniref:hypothetical protein n=1 Tax=Pontixanthobacter aquaemixtae TaxID=1958940 RepID=UPI001370A160|nr:hypothetical protein [Pontixanthobacter aquaemixtae]